MISSTFTALLAMLAPSAVLGFSPVQRHFASAPSVSSSSALHVVDPSSMLDTAQSLWVATIDGDIANIPTNEFATVFAGGIVRRWLRFFAS